MSHALPDSIVCRLPACLATNTLLLYLEAGELTRGFTLKGIELHGEGYQQGRLPTRRVTNGEGTNGEGYQQRGLPTGRVTNLASLFSFLSTEP